ncbi:Chitin synthase chs-1 [Merluccius polli]|uniref:chitin synthase n=1 Tax=Merluccius polli TaxID=89951 RepID=A0AA47P549_MERPO|nr:Chitin synthase chs-1 [Merluccius polli]
MYARGTSTPYWPSTTSTNTIWTPIQGWPRPALLNFQRNLWDTWDPFQLNPVGSEQESKRRCFQLAQYLVAIIVGLAVLTSAVVSKGSILILSMLSSPFSLRSAQEQQFFMLMVVFCLVCPNVLVFFKSLWRCAFKSFVQPNFRTMGIICAIECLVSLGTSILALVVMPQLDVLTNLFISGGVCIMSSILQIVYRLQKETWKIIFPLCSLILILTGYSLLITDYYVRVSSYVDRQENDCYIYIGIGIVASVLVSLCWWENPLQATNNMTAMLTELDTFRDFVFVITSLLRILVIVAVYLIYHFLIMGTIVWSHFKLNDDQQEILQIGLVLFFLQAFCSATCHWFGVVACKIHAVRMGFALPVCCTGPAVLLLGIILFLTHADSLDGYHSSNILQFCDGLVHLSKTNNSIVFLELSRSICRTSLNSSYLKWPFSMLALEGVCMWSGFVTCTYYVWKIKVQRIERTSQLFVRRLYESAFIDLSLLLNTKMKVSRAMNQESHDEIENCIIYLCATMWHETYDEMLKILTSMFRLDRYRGDPKEEHKDCFDFECHIYVDDSYFTEKESDKRLVNEYVDILIHVVIEVYRVFTNKEPDDVAIIETPYGGRLMFVMPEGNMLYVHLKDKELIRNKKRWSQIMYLYYLLGWKGYIAKNPQKITHKNNPDRDSMVSLDGGEFFVPQHDSRTRTKNVSDSSIYLMALDGDTDFQPKALVLLLDRLRMYDNVGAACGRIHPTGMGPMVWYQKFEYAVGHWLQKTAEHVFGSVLCSPGCFSLFRGSALMDDNVLKRYTTTATKAAEYVQYDQGEDRWLCTLLLQQGWRVEYNAASDAYTNSPQEFKEFYNQRRRWGPSTLANTLDLLHSGSETVKRNSSISRLYIFYQMFTVASSILGPASVTLMIAGAFQFVFNLTGTLSIGIAVIPPIFYMIVCFMTKSNTQITIAAIMSVLYAFLMTASFFSIIGEMVMEGTFITPTGIFLVSMTAMYLVTALLHPEEFGMIIYGLMYFICIPSGYLLLTIYSLVNLNIVSWGTRETKEGGELKKTQNMLCDKTCKLCCWDVKMQVTQETDNLMIQQITAAVGQSTQEAQPSQAVIEISAEMELQPSLVTTKEEQGSPETSRVEDDDDDDDDEEEEELEEEEEEDFDYLGNLAKRPEIPASDWVRPVKDEFLKKLTYANLKRNLKQQIRYTLHSKQHADVCEELILMLTDTLSRELSTLGPEDILTDSQLAELEYSLGEQARRILKTNQIEALEKKVKRAIEKTLIAPQVQKLDEGENDFWVKLIERYLTPIKESDAHKQEVSRELKSLRNKAVFLYFIINVLWVVATFFLQAIGHEVLSIKIPKYYPNGTKSEDDLLVEPLSLMFLLSFAVLLLVQFLAMLYHRVYTLIHVVSYRSKEKDYKERNHEDDDDEGMTFNNPSTTNGLMITSDDM